MPTPAQRAHALTSYFEKRYKEQYGNSPVVNRYSARWGWDSVLASLSDAEVKEVINYYFDVPRATHTLDWFFYNYDKLVVSYRESLEESGRRKKLREESQRRAAEWRARVGNK